MSGSMMTLYNDDGNLEVQGSIQFSINYIQRLREFHIFVASCHDLAAADPKRGRSDPWVLCLRCFCIEWETLHRGFKTRGHILLIRVSAQLKYAVSNTVVECLKIVCGRQPLWFSVNSHSWRTLWLTCHCTWNDYIHKHTAPTQLLLIYWCQLSVKGLCLCCN